MLGKYLSVAPIAPIAPVPPVLAGMGKMIEKTELDDLDRGLLANCEKRQGWPLHVVIEPFSDKRSDKVLRSRMKRLARLGFVRLDGETVRGRVLCYIENAGKDALSGWGENPASKGGRSP